MRRTNAEHRSDRVSKIETHDPAPEPSLTSVVGGTMWRVTSRYGYRIHPVTGERKLHAGVDFGLSQGTVIPALTGGLVHRVLPVLPGRTAVVEVDQASALSNLVRHNRGMPLLPPIRWRYVHLSQVAVSPGDVVRRGAPIGRSGGQPGVPGSGPSTTGPHLHLEAWMWTGDGWRSTDPTPLLSTAP